MIPTIYNKSALQTPRGKRLERLGCWPQDIVGTSIECRQRILAHLESVIRTQLALMSADSPHFDFDQWSAAQKMAVAERDAILQLKRKGFDRPAYQTSLMGIK